MSDPKTGKERRKHTPESVMRKVIQCETEVGQNMEALRSELQEHKDAFTTLKEDWDAFIIDFKELLDIFRSAKGFFKVLGWIGRAARWIIGIGIVVGAIVTFMKTGTWK